MTNPAATPRRAAQPRMDRVHGPVAAPAPGLDGRLGPLLRHPRDHRAARAERHPAALDLRQLRLRPLRPADHDGLARRPDRPPQAAADRCGRLRPRLGRRRVRHQRRDAHRGPRAPRDRRRHPDALHAGPRPQPLPGRRAARPGHRHLVRGHDRRNRPRLRPQRCDAEPLLVGLGLPRQRARDAAPAGPGPRAGPGVQGPGPRPLRPAGRAAVHGRRAAGRLRTQGDRRRGLRTPLPGLPRRRPGLRIRLRPPPAHP